MRVGQSTVTVVVVELIHTSHHDSAFVGDGYGSQQRHTRHRFEGGVIRQHAKEHAQRQTVGDFLAHDAIQSRVDRARVDAIFENHAVAFGHAHTHTRSVGEGLDGCQRENRGDEKSDELTHG